MRISLESKTNAWHVLTRFMSHSNLGVYQILYFLGKIRTLLDLQTAQVRLLLKRCLNQLHRAMSAEKRQSATHIYPKQIKNQVVLIAVRTLNQILLVQTFSVPAVFYLGIIFLPDTIIYYRFKPGALSKRISMKAMTLCMICYSTTIISYI